jgi:hypothetical protein
LTQFTVATKAHGYKVEMKGGIVELPAELFDAFEAEVGAADRFHYVDPRDDPRRMFVVMRGDHSRVYVARRPARLVNTPAITYGRRSTDFRRRTTDRKPLPSPPLGPISGFGVDSLPRR